MTTSYKKHRPYATRSKTIECNTFASDGDKLYKLYGYVLENQPIFVLSFFKYSKCITEKGKLHKKNPEEMMF